jgi:hypothetical protein
MYITIDPYYSIDQYNKAKEALKNNGLEVNEYQFIKPPYDWYLELPYKPMLMNFNEFPNTEKRYLVSIVKPVTLQDNITYYRRSANRDKIDYKFILNDCFKDIANSEFIVFNGKSSSQLLNLSKQIQDKIWYLGKYVNRLYKVCIVKYTEATRILIPSESILYERKLTEKIEFFEGNFNYKVFKYRDKLVKFANTPYFEKGLWHAPVIPLQPKARFMRV